MGKAELIKFLGAFADWFPIIILIPSLSLLFNIQSRCLGFCGIKSPYQNGEDDDTEANDSRLIDVDYEEGAKLIKEGNTRLQYFFILTLTPFSRTKIKRT